MARRSPYAPNSVQNAFNRGRGYVPAPPSPPKGVPAPTRPGNSQTGPGVPAPPPDVGGRPLDPSEIAAQVSANRNVALSNANTTYQQGYLDQTYGYGASGAANPYSRAALLQESYQRSQLGTTNNYAGAGQLYSGAYGTAQGENQHQYSIASDANRRAYDQASYQNRYGNAQTVANYGIGVDDSAYNALLNALGVR